MRCLQGAEHFEGLEGRLGGENGKGRLGVMGMRHEEMASGGRKGLEKECGVCQTTLYLKLLPRTSSVFCSPSRL